MTNEMHDSYKWFFYSAVFSFSSSTCFERITRSKHVEEKKNGGIKKPFIRIVHLVGHLRIVMNKSYMRV